MKEEPIVKRLVIASDKHTLLNVCPKCNRRERLRVITVENTCICGDRSLIDISKSRQYDEEWAMMHYRAVLSTWFETEKTVEVSVQEKYRTAARQLFIGLNNSFMLSVEYLGLQRTKNKTNGEILSAHLYRLTLNAFMSMQRTRKEYDIYNPEEENA